MFELKVFNDDLDDLHLPYATGFKCFFCGYECDYFNAIYLDDDGISIDILCKDCGKKNHLRLERF
jgi:transcription elongation factor Elf1